MGIVNVTPDSFSGDGIESEGGATEHALSQLSLGADLLDLGGELTRPGHQPVDERVEMARVIPVIDAVRRARPGAPISVDTYKPDVARAARIAGADLINSVWGAPAELLDVAAELEMPIVAMHNQSGTHYDGPVVDAVLAYLEELRLTRGCTRGSSRTRHSRSGNRFRQERRAESRSARAARSSGRARLSDDDRHVEKIDDREADGERGRRSSLRYGCDDGAGHRGRHRHRASARRRRRARFDCRSPTRSFGVGGPQNGSNNAARSSRARAPRMVARRTRPRPTLRARAERGARLARRCGRRRPSRDRRLRGVVPPYYRRGREHLICSARAPRGRDYRDRLRGSPHRAREPHDLKARYSRRSDAVGHAGSQQSALRSGDEGASRVRRTRKQSRRPSRQSRTRARSAARERHDRADVGAVSNEAVGTPGSAGLFQRGRLARDPPESSRTARRVARDRAAVGTRAHRSGGVHARSISTSCSSTT